MSTTMTLGFDRDGAELALRALSQEFDRLTDAGRDPHSDVELVRLGVWCETIDRWLMGLEDDGAAT